MDDDKTDTLVKETYSNLQQLRPHEFDWLVHNTGTIISRIGFTLIKQHPNLELADILSLNPSHFHQLPQNRFYIEINNKRILLSKETSSLYRNFLNSVISSTSFSKKMFSKAEIWYSCQNSINLLSDNKIRI